MAFFEALDALRQHWDDVQARLDEPARRRLDDLVDRLVTADEIGAQNLVREIVQLVAPEMPPGHPVRTALAGATRYTVLRPEWKVRGWTLQRAGSGVEVEDWLLASPHHAAEELRRRGRDPDQPHLIRLTRPDGNVQLPTFQFGDHYEPLDLVLAVNRLLDAEHDPWGAADWWLGPNTWLSDVPANLVHIADDGLADSLVAAAAALVED